MIVGLDIGRGTAVAAALEKFPPNPQRYFNQYRKNILKLSADSNGVTKLLELNPTAVVMEPTGSWYSRFWKHVAVKHNIPVYWVGHGDLAHQRGSYGFKNKRDDEDAFCLALCYLDERFIDRHDRRRFLQFEDGAIDQLRRAFFEREQLSKDKNILVNQLRQRLCEEFPEIASRRAQPSNTMGYSPLWGWLAGLRDYPALDFLHSSSIVNQLGIELTDFTREHADAICQIELRLARQEDKIHEILSMREFEKYITVFKNFNFGLVNQCQLLYRIYPFDKFLVGGERWIEWEESKGKLQKRDRSLRSFQAYLGMSYKLKQSGNSLTKSFLGSDLSRTHLYMWVVSRVLPRAGIPTAVGKQLSEKVVQLRSQGVTGKDLIMRVLFRATALLYRELCRELL